MSSDIPGYSTSVFRVNNLQQARDIILTPGEGWTAERRWEVETPYLVDLIGSALSLSKDATVLDFGCGIGRMSKALIERFGCRAVGVDISPEMREYAKGYVASDRFEVYSPEALRYKIRQGWRVDHAIAIWVIQHVAEPETDVAALHDAIAPGGGCFVANFHRRCVPTVKGWVDDGKSVPAIFAERFAFRSQGAIDNATLPPSFHDTCEWLVYDRPA